jgi:competence protein ComFC
VKCLVCDKLSFDLICKKCQELHFKPTLKTRVLANGLKVISFYNYEEIKDFLFTKHKIIGSNIFKLLAKNSFKKFAKEFYFPNKVYSLSIDDKVKSGYSHTAILNKQLKSKTIKPLFSKLIAKTQVNYSGKSLDFRLKNPRNFYYKYKPNIDVVLVDDIVTTGTTLTQAKMVLEKHNVNVLFALVLGDVKCQL